MNLSRPYKTNVNKITLFREPSTIEKTKISCSRDIEAFSRQMYGNTISILEDFYIVCLNNSNIIEDFVHISRGGITGTLVDIRILAKIALESLSVGVILVHNHPSGTLIPSQADKNLTQKVKKALGYFDIKILDHLILTENSYFSFADENIL
ncbi:RadC family protein [Lacinutrix iliipiscaria]|uniref:RadC family protein n=1 Tax=Lacinutrix iliipiscaria TaxID=1230532 RepID=A0ABW5WS45_9FLAO